MQQICYTDINNNLLSTVYTTHSNQAGGWSQEGVKLDDVNSNDTKVTCLTTHLTSFPVLVSIRRKKVKRYN